MVLSFEWKYLRVKKSAPEFVVLVFADRSTAAAASREGSLGGYSSAVTGSEGWWDAALQ